MERSISQCQMPFTKRSRNQSVEPEDMLRGISLDDIKPPRKDFQNIEGTPDSHRHVKLTQSKSSLSMQKLSLNDKKNILINNPYGRNGGISLPQISNTHRDYVVSRGSLAKAPDENVRKYRQKVINRIKNDKWSEAKNNPLFCKCKAHLTSSQELQTHLTYMQNQNSMRQSRMQYNRSALEGNSSYVNKTLNPQDIISTPIKEKKELKRVSISTEKLKNFLQDKSSISNQIGKFEVPNTDRSHLIKKPMIGGLEEILDIETYSSPQSTYYPSRTNTRDHSTPSSYQHQNSQHVSNQLWQEENLVQGYKQVDEFYKKYQNIGKIIQKEKIRQIGQSPIVQYLKQVNKEHGVPHILTFKKQKIENSERGLRLKSFYIDKKFANAFSENLKINNQLDSLILNRNVLNDETFEKLVKNLPLNIKRLDISNNKQLTLVTYSKIKELLSDEQRQIHYLNLEGNQMGDSACKLVCEGALESYSIRVLNLSQNKLTDVSAACIAGLLSSNCQLESLLLHWNQIRAKGACKLAKALKRNLTLKIFDASFNSFGSGELKSKKPVLVIQKEKSSSILTKAAFRSKSVKKPVPLFEEFSLSAYKWSKMLALNKRLVHVDLSFNSYKLADVQIMGEGLKKNHTILGIHMMGNEAKVDQLGFVDSQAVQDPAEGHVFTRIPTNLKAAVVPKSIIKLNVTSNCWICEGWTQMIFRINSAHALPYLHLSFEEFKPNQMHSSDSNNHEYVLHRMMPPGNHTYFYSNGEQNTFTDNKQSTQLNPQPLISNAHISISVPKMNYVENIQQAKHVLTPDDLTSLKAEPRPEAIKTVQVERPKSPWSLPKSIFASYQFDTDEHLAKCFQFDWSCSKLEKLVRSIKDKEKMFSYLNANYRSIREAYKFFSSLGPSGNVFSIGTNVFSDVIYNCQGLLDSKTVKTSDIDLEFISTKAGNAFRGKNNPDRQLIRFQFLEIFVRLAVDKYYKTKIVDTYDGAVHKLMEESVLPSFRKFNSNEFRLHRLWNEPCDIAIKSNLQIFKDIYNKHSGRESLPSEQKFMSMNEFIDLVTLSQVIDDNFGAREVGTIFNLSMMTQVDEITKDRHYQMSFIEFIEALSRVAERVIVLGASDEEQFQLHYQSDESQGNENKLDQKIVEYARRVAVTCMGEEYAYQYKKKQAFKNKKKTLESRINDKAMSGDESTTNRAAALNDSGNTTPMSSRVGSRLGRQSSLSLRNAVNQVKAK